MEFLDSVRGTAFCQSDNPDVIRRVIEKTANIVGTSLRSIRLLETNAEMLRGLTMAGKASAIDEFHSACRRGLAGLHDITNEVSRFEHVVRHVGRPLLAIIGGMSDVLAATSEFNESAKFAEFGELHGLYPLNIKAIPELSTEVSTHLCTVFVMMRNHGVDLRTWIELMPMAREEYARALEAAFESVTGPGSQIDCSRLRRAVGAIKKGIRNMGDSAQEYYTSYVYEGSQLSAIQQLGEDIMRDTDDRGLKIEMRQFFRLITRRAAAMSNVDHGTLNRYKKIVNQLFNKLDEIGD